MAGEIGGKLIFRSCIKNFNRCWAAFIGLKIAGQSNWMWHPKQLAAVEDSLTKNQVENAENTENIPKFKTYILSSKSLCNKFGEI